MIRIVVHPKDGIYESVMFKCGHCIVHSYYERRPDGRMPKMRNRSKCAHCNAQIPNMNMMIDDTLTRVANHIIQ